MSDRFPWQVDSGARDSCLYGRLRVLYAAGLVVAVLALVAWWFIESRSDVSPGHSGPMPRAVLRLREIEVRRSGTWVLPTGLRWEAGRIVADSDGAELAHVPGGDVELSNRTGGGHRVSVKSLYVDRHEVTVLQFKAFCRAKGAKMPPQPIGSSLQYPMVNVTWQLAVEYGEWAGRRLPTEAEWQRAACGDDQRVYPWGNVDRPSCRNGPGNGDGWAGLAPVGTFPDGASPFGCVDMAGNAWEWCADSAPPEGGGAGGIGFVYRVLKGGSALWEEPLYLRSSSRAALVSFNVQGKGMGFRLVRDE